MLEFALSGLLLLQTASASPNVVPPVGAPGAEEEERPTATPRPTPRGRRGTTPSPSPTPVPTPTPTPRASNDLLVVVNKSDNSLSVLDAATGKLKWTAPVETGPHEAEVLPDGKTVAVGDYGRAGAPGRMVSFIELATGKVLGRIDLGAGARPHGLAALKDGRLLVTAEGKKELVVVDPKSAKVLSRMPTGHSLSHMVAASPDGKRAYVSSLKDAVVTVIDLAGGVVGDVQTGKGAEGIDVTPDGREVWVVNREANTISIIDTKTLKVAATIKAGAFPIRVRITPDGKRAVVTFTESGDVGVFDVATRIEIKRIPIGRDAVAGSGARVFQGKFGTSPAPVGVLIAPDGKRAFVAATHADVVVAIDLENLKVQDAWATGKEPDGLAGRFEKK
jgi:YVTN family beta-propeller protein